MPQNLLKEKLSLVKKEAKLKIKSFEFSIIVYDLPYFELNSWTEKRKNYLAQGTLPSILRASLALLVLFGSIKQSLPLLFPISRKGDKLILRYLRHVSTHLKKVKIASNYALNSIQSRE